MDKDGSSVDGVGVMDLDSVVKVEGSSLGDADMGMRMPTRFLT